MKRLSLLIALTPLLAAAQGASELRGRVVDEAGAPIPDAIITIAAIGYSVRSDASGAFALAGTPGSTLVLTLSASGYRSDSAAVVLTRGKAVVREFKLLSEATGPPEPNPSDRVLRGRVVDLEGSPLTYANIQINGGRRLVADDSGRFAVPLPGGRFSLLVRRIGFAPEELKFDAPPDTALRVRMTAVATALPEQRVTGRAAFVSLDLNGFYRRMREAERGINHGYFVTPEDFEFRKPYQITQMVEGYPTVSVKRSFDPKKDIIIGALRCKMTVYLDRVRIVGKLGNFPDDFVNELVLPNHVAAMEIYPRAVGAPPEYQPLNGTCGVVLIWSK